MRQRLARLLLVAGGVLLLVWAAGMAHRTLVGGAAQRAFLATIAASPIPTDLERASPSGDGASPIPRDPDTRGWNGARVTAYLEALAGPPAAQPLAVLEIPRLAVSALVLDGIDEWSLNRGVGRIPGTGADGNLGIAGHRDGFFRALRDIAPGDVIEWRGREGVVRYRVEWTRVVAPEDVSVLAPTESPALTLVTCHPFYYVGSAPERFIVRARRAALEAASPGDEPASADVSRARERPRATEGAGG